MIDQVERFLEKKFAHNILLRKQISALYQSYNTWGIKDSKFDKDFCDGRNDHFYPYLWEMLLAHHLKGLGFHLRSEDAGPDFKIEYNDQTLWIEATCPNPKTNKNDPIGTLRTAINNKTEKLVGSPLRQGRERPGYLAKGMVKDQDLYVIALNTCRITSSSKALISQTLMQDGYDQASPIYVFQEPKYKNISAILFSAQDIQTLQGENPPILLVHNPWAKNKLPHNILGATEEYVFES